MAALELSRYRFHFVAREMVRLPVFAGSTWRGAFGTALKRTVCATRMRDCAPCPLLSGCSFPTLFEGRRPQHANGLSGVERIPVPYLIQPPPQDAGPVAAGTMVQFDLVLVGQANAHLIYVVHALAQAGANGIGPGRGRLSLERVERLSDLDGKDSLPVFENGQFKAPGAAPVVSPARSGHNRLRVELLTPLRLKLDGRLVTPESFRPAHLLDAAVRRVSALASFHSDNPVQADFKELKALAARTGMQDASLRWEDWKRRSSRQDQVMAMGGLRGAFTLELPADAAPLLPWLELGQWVGVGKGASMGLGQIRLIGDGRV